MNRLTIILLLILIPALQEKADYRSARKKMVLSQIITRGVKDPSTLAAMRFVPRHKFVPDYLEDNAYKDSPLPIGFGQTISQPYTLPL